MLVFRSSQVLKDMSLYVNPRATVWDAFMLCINLFRSDPIRDRNDRIEPDDLLRQTRLGSMVSIRPSQLIFEQLCASTTHGTFQNDRRTHLFC
jgi:hypothetical protein